MSVELMARAGDVDDEPPGSDVHELVRSDRVPSERIRCASRGQRHLDPFEIDSRHDRRDDGPAPAAALLHGFMVGSPLHQDAVGFHRFEQLSQCEPQTVGDSGKQNHGRGLLAPLDRGHHARAHRARARQLSDGKAAPLSPCAHRGAEFRQIDHDRYRSHMTAIEAQPGHPGFVVRDATDADADAVARIFAHYVATTATTFETEPRNADQWRTLWATLREAGWPHLVGVRDDQVVGFAYISPWRAKPAYRHTVESTVYLAPDATGRGYGRELTRRVLDAATANGAREVIAVIADTGNPASRALHRALGFSDIGTLERVGHKFDRWIDVCLMQKSLRNSA